MAIAVDRAMKASCKSVRRVGQIDASPLVFAILSPKLLTSQYEKESFAYRLNCLCSFEKNREKFSALRTNTPIYNLGQDSVILSSRTPEEHDFVLKMIN